MGFVILRAIGAVAGSVAVVAGVAYVAGYLKARAKGRSRKLLGIRFTPPAEHQVEVLPEPEELRKRA